ncbi:MAG: hypothetical protein J5643_07345 [Lachnospiraceae bacterium]|nr:hypothetical protein [Lachnospiraceae bacterium]
MEFTARQQRIVLAVFNELLMKRSAQLHMMLGSETIKEMSEIAFQLRHEPYCKRHGIKAEDMTEDDFLREYEEDHPIYDSDLIREWE